MPYETTIDGAGRLVIPKAIRDRLRLSPGARLTVTEEEGRIVLSADRPATRIEERNGYLVVHIGEAMDELMVVGRDERIAELVAYALQR